MGEPSIYVCQSNWLLTRRLEMNRYDAIDTVFYKVVVNHQGQYALWPTGRDNPPGWRDCGKSGSTAECLSYIEDVWTDMRPLSLRRQMDQAATH
jgi:MbtH protein